VNIKNYTAFFHDGSIYSINHVVNEIDIFMESAELEEDYIADELVLTKDNRIKGILHILHVNKIIENGKLLESTLKMKFEDAEIFHFDLNQNKVILQIKWDLFPPKPSIKDFSNIEIEADSVWWENLPNLEAP